MFDRANIVHENFKNFLINHDKKALAIHCNIPNDQLIDLLETQMMSRLLDIKSRSLRKINKSFYTISSSGHEGMAVVGLVARLDDMAFLHYRDAAFMIQRSKKLAGQTILSDFLKSFMACSDDPISGGRHKVLGSKELFIPPQTSTIASHLPKAVGFALAIDRARHLKMTQAAVCSNAVSVCTFGDASLNHASAQTAINCAQWISYQNIPLPLVFICEDNKIGISVPTPTEWVKNSQSTQHSLQYFEANGLDLLETYHVTEKAFDYAREKRKPCFLRIKTVRLLGHAGSDIETSYRNQKQIEESEAKDPLLYSADLLIKNSILTKDQILKMYLNLEKRIDRIGISLMHKNPLLSSSQIMNSIVPTYKKRNSPDIPTLDQRKTVFDKEWDILINQAHPLGKLLNFALTDLMLQYPEVIMFGEDIAKKGGVYNVTAKLESRFGNRRVFNSLLDETCILGTAIGMAHNGFLPIPEIQFLAYFHNAQDQLRGEAATLSFFSAAQFTNGIVIRVAGLAYQKGFGGHFHNDNSISIFRDLPGVILACPSHGEDAVKMLRTCVKEAFEYGRVIIFLEPIALYPTRDIFVTGDNLWCKRYPLDLEESIPVGEFFVDPSSYGTTHKKLDDICILSYANGYFLSQQARKILSNKYHVSTISLIDLRWPVGYNKEKLAMELSRFKYVLIVDECRQSGSLSEELMSFILERCTPCPRMKRLCGKDSFIPLGDAANLVLLQVDDIVDSCLRLIKTNSKDLQSIHNVKKGRV